MRSQWYGWLWLSLCLTGCQSPWYYGHLAKGQWQMISQRQPIAKVITNPKTAPKLVGQLQAIQRIRTFAQSLDLPIKDQFDTYVDIQRPYAQWSVSATPALSLTPLTWCQFGLFCLSFRNYFAEKPAQEFAQKLTEEGYDSYIGRVTAYSTLGWFRDSLLSSYIYRSEADLAELLFHELAHQVVYASNDPVFNESFAEVVAYEGLQRYWLTHPEDIQRLLRTRQQQTEFAQWVLTYRAQLQKIYQLPLAEAEKQRRKAELFSSLRDNYQQLKTQQWQGYNGYDAWINQANNASLNSIAVYHDLIPPLTAILAATNHDLPRFYTICRRLAQLPKAQRHAILLDEQRREDLLHD